MMNYEGFNHKQAVKHLDAFVRVLDNPKSTDREYQHAVNMLNEYAPKMQEAGVITAEEARHYYNLY